MECYCKHCGHRLGTVDNVLEVTWISWKCRVCKLENIKQEFIDFNLSYMQENRQYLRRAWNDQKLYLKVLRRYAYGH
jgi:hypothetical protein